jgi:hypothetical protein
MFVSTGLGRCRMPRKVDWVKRFECTRVLRIIAGAVDSRVDGKMYMLC